MLVSVCIGIDRQMQTITFSWLRVIFTQIFTKNIIIRKYYRDRSCEQAIFVLHDLRVDYIAEHLYFYSMISPIQWVQCSMNYWYCPVYLKSYPSFEMPGWRSTSIAYHAGTVILLSSYILQIIIRPTCTCYLTTNCPYTLNTIDLPSKTWNDPVNFLSCLVAQNLATFRWQKISRSC